MYVPLTFVEKITKRHAQKKTCIRLYNTILGMLPQPPPTSCEYRLTTVPQTTRNLLKFQGMSPGFPEAALSHAKSGEDWSPFTSTYDCERSFRVSLARKTFRFMPFQLSSFAFGLFAQFRFAACCFDVCWGGQHGHTPRRIHEASGRTYTYVSSVPCR